MGGGDSCDINTRLEMHTELDAYRLLETVHTQHSQGCHHLMQRLAACSYPTLLLACHTSAEAEPLRVKLKKPHEMHAGGCPPLHSDRQAGNSDQNLAMQVQTHDGQYGNAMRVTADTK